jgi:hypothetical protein
MLTYAVSRCAIVVPRIGAAHRRSRTGTDLSHRMFFEKGSE